MSVQYECLKVALKPPRQRPMPLTALPTHDDRPRQRGRGPIGADHTPISGGDRCEHGQHEAERLSALRGLFPAKAAHLKLVRATASRLQTGMVRRVSGHTLSTVRGIERRIWESPSFMAWEDVKMSQQSDRRVAEQQ
jgi:hypothetical protein